MRSTPFIPARVTLDAREIDHRFTMHSRIANVAGAPEAATSYTAVADGSAAKLDVLVGSGLQFWITRDAEDGTANQPAAPTTAAGATIRNTWTASVANLTFQGAACFPANPQRAAALVARHFRVNAQADKRAGHHFRVRMSDGYSTVFTGTAHPDPVTGAAVPAYATGQIVSWGGIPVSNPLPIHTFTAMVDPTRLITLHDDSILAGGGLAAQMTVDVNVNPTDAFAFDGWVPAHNPPPSPTITVQPANQSRPAN